MSVRLQKTEAGREAIRRRDGELSRAARNLLLILDPSRPAEAWLAAVAGAQPADLERLIALGYVAEPEAPAALPPGVSPARAALQALLPTLDVRLLYARLTAEARPLLGLVKGYRLVLDLERSGPEQLPRLAQRFVDELEAAQGTAAALDFCRRLGTPG